MITLLLLSRLLLKTPERENADGVLKLFLSIV